MNLEQIQNIRFSLPWLVRYPFSRLKTRFRSNYKGKRNLIFCIANHFEPGWNGKEIYSIDVQRRRLESWSKDAARIGEIVRDTDGTKFRHTNFYPAEQYDSVLLSQMSELSRDGLGEVEVHLHHGIEGPDNAENLERNLIEFRDVLADEHKCLSRLDGVGKPMYAFVHGNWALDNSAGGMFCGVDNEMAILRETGCYADMTLPSAPDRSQVPVINSIYECGLPLEQAAAHRKGRRLRVGVGIHSFPVIITGPLLFDWSKRIGHIPIPKVENGELAHFRANSIERLKRWIDADISIEGRPDWVFIKLHCHGFFDHDRSACIGDDAIRFFSEIINHGERTDEYTVHFTSAREMFNIIMACVDGKTGSPNNYRDYRLKRIMDVD